MIVYSSSIVEVELLRPSDSLGPSVAEKVAKLVNEKFSIDLGVEKRKEISEMYRTPENMCGRLQNITLWVLIHTRSFDQFTRSFDLKVNL
jgi:hypothetical protein